MITSATAVNATSAMRNSSDTTGCGPVGIAHLNVGIAHLILNFIAAPSKAVDSGQLTVNSWLWVSILVGAPPSLRRGGPRRIIAARGGCHEPTLRPVPTARL